MDNTMVPEPFRRPLVRPAKDLLAVVRGVEDPSPVLKRLMVWYEATWGPNVQVDTYGISLCSEPGSSPWDRRVGEVEQKITKAYRY
jgi:hypothetical protein